MISFPSFRFRYPSFYYPYYNNYIQHSPRNNSSKKISPDISNKHNSNQKKFNYENELKQQQTKSQLNKKNDNIEYQNKSIHTNNNKYRSFGPISFNNNILNSDLDDPLIEILGISLYLDDLIILGLLFILYKEDVQDEILFLSLILLLLG